MAIDVTKVEVWAGPIRDEAGALAAALGALADAGAALDCVIARREDNAPGQGVVFVTPIKGRRLQNAASDAGMKRADVATLRVEGPDRPGLGARLTRAVADAGINLKGVSAMTMGNRFVAYFGFDSDADATTASRALRGADRTSGKKTTKKATKKATKKTSRRGTTMPRSRVRDRGGSPGMTV